MNGRSAVVDRLNCDNEPPPGEAQELTLGHPCIPPMFYRTIPSYVTPFVLATWCETRSASLRNSSGLSSEYSGSVPTPTGS